MNNLELDLLTARAALPRAQRGTTIDFINARIKGNKVRMTVRGRQVTGTVRTVDATAHGLVVYVTVAGKSESALLSQTRLA